MMLVVDEDFPTLPSEKAKLTKSSQWSSLFLYSLFVIWTNGNRQIIDLTMVD